MMRLFFMNKQNMQNTQRINILLHYIAYIFASVLIISLTACTNSNLRNRKPGSAGNGNDGGTSDNFKISTVNITTDPAGGTNSGQVAKIYFDTANSKEPITNYCSVSGSTGTDAANTCMCQFTWKEVNTTSTNAVTVPRSVLTQLIAAQNYYITCKVPVAFENEGEIPVNTVIKISVIPVGASNGNLSMKAFNYTKGSVQADGDFYSDEGEAFLNIHRYSCYEKFSRGLGITNKQQEVTNSITGLTKKVVLGTSFCVTSIDGSTNCPDNDTNATIKESAQSYYYNLYVNSRNRGNFHLDNKRFSCPLVKEALDNSGSIGEDGKPWPLDATFALATRYSADFNVPITAPSVLTIVDDPSTQSTACDMPGSTDTDNGSGGSTSGNSDSSIAIKCLGFAQKPNSDGTCPAFTDEHGLIRQTYRLRKMIAMYPPTFETTGKIFEQTIGADIIYVLDRPVNSGDPLKPYTMLGPKPCNFAYFDRNGVTGLYTGTNPAAAYNSDPIGGDGGIYYDTLGIPGYVATNNTNWDGKSVDNIYFPNTDNPETNSCAATLPLIKYNANGNPSHVNMATTHSSNMDGANAVQTVSIGGGRTIPLNKVFVRPMAPWAPHYTEDTGFEACAPQADPMRDPPLHFAKSSTGNIGWCALAYPSQVDAVEELDVPYNGELENIDLGGGQNGGSIAPDNPAYAKLYTSPVVKNSASAKCVATPLTLPSTYPADGTLWAANGACGAGGNDTRYASRKSLDRVFVDQDSSGTNHCSAETCDRTVINPGNGTWMGIPLVAPPNDIENMLRTDNSYECTITWDDGGTKSQEGKTPSSGCCSSAIVDLSNVANGVQYNGAHLEPDKSCLQPTY